MIVHTGRKIYFLETDRITYIEACNYYALIHEGNKTLIVREALKDLEKKLCPKTFIRIHRSIILNINIFKCIEKTDNTLLVKTTIGKDFKVSRQRKRNMKEKIYAERIATKVLPQPGF
jgi:two-component system LytT family response regulator